MALKLKYTDEHGILHIDMAPNSSPGTEGRDPEADAKTDISGPKFDTINNRFGQYDLFGGKYEMEGEERSLFRSRYNSIEHELANTPYAFAPERSLRLNSASPLIDITIQSRVTDTSPSKDIEDDRFFNRNVDYDLFGPQIDLQVKTSDEEDSPAFTVTQLIHAQDRYFDLSSRQSSTVVGSPGDRRRTRLSDSAKTVEKSPITSVVSDKTIEKQTPRVVKSSKTISKTQTQVLDNARTGKRQSSRVTDSYTSDPVRQVRSEPVSARTVKIVNKLGAGEDGAFQVLSETEVKTVEPVATNFPVLPTAKRKKESSFAIISETPIASRPSSPRSLPVEIRTGRVSPFKGRGFREETSRHTTPRTSAANSRASSPPRRRTNSLSRIDKMSAATLPPPIPSNHTLSRPHSPRNFLKENIEEVREISELNREKHEAEAERLRREEEEALLMEMADFDNNKTDAIRSVVCSRTTSRSNSPNKLNLRSRSNSPSAALSPSAVLRYENLTAESNEYINGDDGMKPVTHNSRRSVSKSQPQSNDGSPKHSKIPKRQSSVSPSRNNNRRESSNSRSPVENSLNKNQRFISNSTSSIHETIRIGGQAHDKKAMSKSTQLLNIAPAHIKGKPPISPGRSGPPPSNKSINAKRLSPIVGTPNKSPIEDLKPGSARTPAKTSTAARKPIKTAGNTPATSRLTSRQPSRNISRDPSPDKRRVLSKTTPNNKVANNSAKSKPVARAVTMRTTTKPIVPIKTEPKKPINRTNSMKSLIRIPSTKNLSEKPPLKKIDSKMDLRSRSTGKLNELASKREPSASLQKKDMSTNDKRSPKKVEKGKDVIDKENIKNKENTKPATSEAVTNGVEVTTQDNETQYDKITNDKGELVILTKKNIISMTTAAITSQPLEVVTKVTNQLPATLEKAREKAIFERLSSKDSLAPKEDDREATKTEEPKSDQAKSEPSKTDVTKLERNEPPKESVKNTDKDKAEAEKSDDKKSIKPSKVNEIKSTVFHEDNVKLKPLLPPYNNPQVERAKQKIDDILKSPEVSIENIATAPVPKARDPKSIFRNIAAKTKSDIKAKDEVATKLTNIKDQIVKQNEKTAAEIRSEASKIVDSIITPVEEPKEIEKPVVDVKKDIEPIVMVVNEKINEPKNEIMEKMTETLVKGDAEVEVQSSNVSTPRLVKREEHRKKAEGSDSDRSLSNGGFPQSTSTTPKPPLRTKKEQIKEEFKQPEDSNEPAKKPSLGQRIIGKCKRCCPCCTKVEEDGKREMEDVEKERKGVMSRLNCCGRNAEAAEREVQRTAEKLQTASIEFENETKRSRKLRDVMCGCCGRRRRVSDVSDVARQVSRDLATSGAAGDTGCCGKRRPDVERRDSILSDRPPPGCCNNRVFTWVRGACRRHQSEAISSSRRQSLFSKNKSLSPTLPPEDTRTKLDPSLVEHTSVMRGAIPVLPIALAYFCLVCNVVVPGLGTIFSGIFCLCFGIPRFGVHDGAKYRIGSLVINLLVGCGQLFTVLFCLVGWGWSIWWGVIMLRASRKYRKLKAEEAAEEAEAAPPVTANNHTRA